MALKSSEADAAASRTPLECRLNYISCYLEVDEMALLRSRHYIYFYLEMKNIISPRVYLGAQKHRKSMNAPYYIFCHFLTGYPG